MCGILGIFSFKKLNQKKNFQKSLNLIKHRGPDNQGIYYGDNIYLGHNRLSIIDLSKNNIRVNAVAPGVIRTPLTERYFQDKEVAKKINGIHAMNRVGEPEEVSNAVRFLASDESSFCTGSILTVDGGWTAGKFM